jgi:hypothetical protein
MDNPSKIGELSYNINDIIKLKKVNVWKKFDDCKSELNFEIILKNWKKITCKKEISNEKSVNQSNDIYQFNLIDLNSIHNFVDEDFLNIEIPVIQNQIINNNEIVSNVKKEYDDHIIEESSILDQFEKLNEL